MQKVHLSIDDVIYSFMDLIKTQPESVFDVPFFSLLKELNAECGAVFTLYCYENYANQYFVNKVPLKYWHEIEKCGFISVGYHGSFSDFDEAVFIKQCLDFYANIPNSIFAKTLRLHKYSCNEAAINLLKNFGVNELLCREEKSRELLGINTPSYVLSPSEEQRLNYETLIKDDIKYTKTDIRLEFYDEENLKREIEKLSENKEVLIVYTHEKKILENEELLKNSLNILRELKSEFIF